MNGSGKLIAKVNGRGVVWASRTVGYNRYAYQMEAAGSTKGDYHLIEEIVVYPEPGAGWQVRIDGDPVATYPYKSDAQLAAESLLDNNRDRFGWPLKTTGLA